MEAKNELFTIGTREDLKRLEDKGFEMMYEELEAIGSELGDTFYSIIYDLYEHGVNKNETVHDVSDSYRTYAEYYKKFIGRFGRMAVGQVEYDGVDLQQFLNRAQSLPTIDRHRTNEYQVQIEEWKKADSRGEKREANQNCLSFVKESGETTKYICSIVGDDYMREQMQEMFEELVENYQKIGALS